MKHGAAFRGACARDAFTEPLRFIGPLYSRSVNQEQKRRLQGVALPFDFRQARGPGRVGEPEQAERPAQQKIQHKQNHNYEKKAHYLPEKFDLWLYDEKARQYEKQQKYQHYHHNPDIGFHKTSRGLTCAGRPAGSA